MVVGIKKLPMKAALINRMIEIVLLPVTNTNRGNLYDVLRIDINHVNKEFYLLLITVPITKILNLIFNG